MFLQDAEVHHDEDAGLAGLFGGQFVDYTFLHPDSWDFQLYGLVDNLLHKLGSAEDVHDIDFWGGAFLRNIVFIQI